MEPTPNEGHSCKFLSLAELAARWKVHPKTVTRWIKEGRPGREPIVPVRIGRKYLYPLTLVEDWEEGIPKALDHGAKEPPSMRRKA